MVGLVAVTLMGGASGGMIEDVKADPYRYTGLFTGAVGTSSAYEDMLGFSLIGRQQAVQVKGHTFTPKEVKKQLQVYGQYKD